MCKAVRGSIVLGVYTRAVLQWNLIQFKMLLNSKAGNCCILCQCIAVFYSSVWPNCIAVYYRIVLQCIAAFNVNVVHVFHFSILQYCMSL